MTWGAYVQQGNLAEIEELGAQLSLKIGCSVHYPAFGKNLFECRCGVTFPIYVVKGATESGDWEAVLEIHRNRGRE